MIGLVIIIVVANCQLYILAEQITLSDTLTRARHHCVFVDHRRSLRVGPGNRRGHVRASDWHPIRLHLRPREPSWRTHRIWYVSLPRRVTILGSLRAQNRRRGRYASVLDSVPIS